MPPPPPPPPSPGNSGDFDFSFFQSPAIPPTLRGQSAGKTTALLPHSLICFHCTAFFAYITQILVFPPHWGPFKNEQVAARLQLGCCYYAAIKYVCNNWWRQSSQLEQLVACLQQPCSFYQRLQAHRATTRSQLQLAAVTSKKTARTHSL